ncbi:MAG: DUF3078 domain-containing protein [Bacteroidaceae bacterium]|nr:DUF3078 domain-containing protein [Bacteroidaceae bacterium]
MICKKLCILLFVVVVPHLLLAQTDGGLLWQNPLSRMMADSVAPAESVPAVGEVDLKVYDVAMRYTQRLDSLKAAYHHWKYVGSDTLSNPYYSSLFAAPTLLPGTLRRSIGTLPTEYGSSDAQNRRVQAIDRVLLSVYGTKPWLVRKEQAEAPRPPIHILPPPPPQAAIHISQPTTPQREEPIDLVRPDFNIQTHRPNFWTFKADLSLRFMQNFISENWYKGGESNNSFLANAVLELNYDNKRKLTFTNKLEMKLGFYSSKSDSVHRYKTNTDLLRLTNKLGLQASKHWYYTIMLQSWTQFYRGYKSNNPTIFSDFGSPFETVLSLGMDYKLSVKRFTLSATLSPFALDYKFVGRRRLATSFGVDEGHHTKLDYGSTITANATWTPFTNVTLKSRLYWFTDYSRTTIEWENTISFKINEYLNTELFLYPRFDDGVKRTEGHSYLQFKEYLSLGVSFKL